MKLALVVQRYGPEVAGGSEAHCREIAERLAAGGHRVTVLTSCAHDYITWRNHYPAGTSEERGVTVHRFRARPRDLARFWELSQIVLSGQGRPDEEIEWFRHNGPRTPELIAHLERHGADYDRVLFWTYRYYPSFFGLPKVAERAILLPTAEEDPAIGIGVLREFFRLPAGHLFLTAEEARLVEAAAGGGLEPADVIGGGLDPAPPIEAAARGELDALGLGDGFLLYLGRVDRNKGCATMFDHYRRWADAADHPLPLAVAGRAAMPIPDHPGIRPLGFVSEPLRQALLAAARALLMPSPYESLSLVLLEAWNHRRPALVNGRCRVLRGQVRRADGGLWYDSFEQFHEGAELLVGEPAIADRLGAQGHDYVERHYRWPTVIGKVEAALRWPPRAAADDPP